MFAYRWREATLDKLAGISVAANLPDRDRIAAGVEQFNSRLSTDQSGIGESRGSGYRVVFLPLLMVYYHVDDVTRQVRVLEVIRYGR